MTGEYWAELPAVCLYSVTSGDKSHHNTCVAKRLSNQSHTERERKKERNRGETRDGYSQPEESLHLFLLLVILLFLAHDGFAMHEQSKGQAGYSGHNQRGFVSGM